MRIAASGQGRIDSLTWGDHFGGMHLDFAFVIATRPQLT
jgi:hypothetical protein